jgi:nucleotide-binding universal stress UspA family protein
MSILVATDFSENAQTAVHAAAYLAKQRDMPLTVAHCLQWTPEVPNLDEQPSGESGDANLENVRTELKSHVDDLLSDAERDLEDLCCEVFAGNPDEELIDAVEHDGHEMVVVGATGMDRVSNFLLGSLPEEIVRRSPVPVLVVPPEIEAGGYNHIVAPVDLTPCSRESLTHAAQMAREHDARLTLLHAVPFMTEADTHPLADALDLGPPSDLQKQARQHLEGFIDDISLEGIESETRIEMGPPKNVIGETVDELNADLVAMGTHGRRGVAWLFLGSTATKVLRSMPCSVMTIRWREDQGES